MKLQSCGLQSTVCAGTRTLGEPAGPPSRPPNTPSPVVDCRSKTMPTARAVRWTGNNRADVEALTGRCVADSLCTEGTILVDAWAALTVPLVCPEGYWVVAEGFKIVVLPPSAFFAEFKIVRPRRVTAQEAA